MMKLFTLKPENKDEPKDENKEEMIVRDPKPYVVAFAKQHHIDLSNAFNLTAAQVLSAANKVQKFMFWEYDGEYINEGNAPGLYNAFSYYTSYIHSPCIHAMNCFKGSDFFPSCPSFVRTAIDKISNLDDGPEFWGVSGSFCDVIGSGGLLLVFSRVSNNLVYGYGLVDVLQAKNIATLIWAVQEFKKNFGPFPMCSEMSNLFEVSLDNDQNYTLELKTGTSDIKDILIVFNKSIEMFHLNMLDKAKGINSYMLFAYGHALARVIMFLLQLMHHGGVTSFTASAKECELDLKHNTQTIECWSNAIALVGPENFDSFQIGVREGSRRQATGLTNTEVKKTAKREKRSNGRKNMRTRRTKQESNQQTRTSYSLVPMQVPKQESNQKGRSSYSMAPMQFPKKN